MEEGGFLTVWCRLGLDSVSTGVVCAGEKNGYKLHLGLARPGFKWIEDGVVRLHRYGTGLTWTPFPPGLCVYGEKNISMPLGLARPGFKWVGDGVRILHHSMTQA